MQHVGSRDSNVQSPALFFAVKSSIIMESYHNVTITLQGNVHYSLKFWKQRKGLLYTEKNEWIFFCLHDAE